MEVQGGAAAVVERALFRGNRDIAVAASNPGTTLQLHDGVIARTLSRESDRKGGQGLSVTRGATATVERVVVDENREVAVFASGAGTTLRLRDAAVRDTRAPEADGSDGLGLLLRLGATAAVERALFERNRGFAVVADGEGAALDFHDAVIRDTLSDQGDGAFGLGLNVQDGASATARGALIERNRVLGVFVGGAGAMLELKDAVVRDTMAQDGDGRFGRGLEVNLGATAVVERVLVEGNRDHGVLADGPSSTIELRNAIVRDTLGRGMSVQLGAGAIVENVLLERNRETGLLAGGADVALEVRDVVVRDTRPAEGDGRGGRGLIVQQGAAAVVERALLERNLEIAALASRSDTMLVLRDAVVRDTLPAACAPACVSGLNYGAGLASVNDARLTIRRFRLEANDLCGLLLGSNGEADLDSGVVSGHVVGACLQQVPGFDTGRLLNDVQYVDNGRLVEATDLVLPRPVEVVDAVPR
jgi:hypothetical protein